MHRPASRFEVEPLEPRTFLTGSPLTITGNTSVQEAETYVLALPSIGSDSSTLTGWTVNWGDGATDNYVGPFGENFTVNHAYADGSSTTTRSIWGTATSDTDTFDTNTLDVSVLNVAPTISISGEAMALMSTAYRLNFSATDPGQDTITSWRVNGWYEGGGTPTFDGSASYGDLGVHPGWPSWEGGNVSVTVTAFDEDGGFTSSSIGVEIIASPTLTVAGDAAVDEGSSYVLQLGSNYPLTSWSINWGDGSDPDEDNVVGQIITGGTTQVTHTFADGSNDYDIQARPMSQASGTR